MKSDSQDSKFKFDDELLGRMSTKTTIGAQRKTLQHLSNELLKAAKADSAEEKAYNKEKAALVDKYIQEEKPELAQKVRDTAYLDAAEAIDKLQKSWNGKNQGEYISERNKIWGEYNAKDQKCKDDIELLEGRAE